MDLISNIFLGLYSIVGSSGHILYRVYFLYLYQESCASMRAYGTGVDLPLELDIQLLHVVCWVGQHREGGGMMVNQNLEEEEEGVKKGLR